MAPVGIAILGSGIFAREQHRPAIEACGDLELKAVYSRTRASVEKLLASGNETTSVSIYSDDSGPDADLSALLARADIAAVTIALPINAQPAVIRRALAAGKHVLSEKPVAPTVSDAVDLLSWYRAQSPSSSSPAAATPAIWAVAENIRFLQAFSYAREQLDLLSGAKGVLGFSVDVASLVQPGTKYFETAWRKTPEYQGGFFLDGGVHWTAALRILLGNDKIKKVVALSALNYEHLPPVDTVNAVMKLESGAVGSFLVSFGTSRRSYAFTVAVEGGEVIVERDGVVTVRKKDGEVEVKTFPEDKTGVPQEVKAFAKSVIAGKPDPLQTPENALADLELIELMVNSGDNDGKTLEVKGEF